jgi:hypothetical protein
MAAGASASEADDAPPAAVGGPMPTATLRTTPQSGAASPSPAPAPSRAPAAQPEGDHLDRSLRVWALGASMVGTVAFFIPWFRLGGTGIELVEAERFKTWGPPSPSLLFGLMLAALVLCIIGSFAHRGALIPGLTAVLGALLTVGWADVLWLSRHQLSGLTGLWLLVGASVVLLVSSLASVLRERAS